jgi:hypothetical protein
MRTPVHIMPTEQGPSVRRDAKGWVLVRDLIVSAGPKEDQGRLARLMLSDREARQLCIGLGRLFGADVQPCQACGGTGFTTYANGEATLRCHPCGGTGQFGTQAAPA